MAVFQDGQVGTTQETAGDMSAWTAAGGVVVNALRPHHGVNDFYMVEDGTEDQANVDFGAGGTFANPHLRAYFNFSSIGGEVGGLSSLLELRDAIGTFRMRALLHENAGTVYFASLDPDVGVIHDTVIAPVVNTWYEVQIGWTKTNPGGPYLWIDGVSRYDENQDMSAIPDARFIYMGAYTSLSYNAYADCVVADLAYIPSESINVIRRQLLNVGL